MLYVLKAGSVAVKIGYAQDALRVAKRVRTLQTGNHLPLKVVGVVDGVGPRTEHLVHKLLADERTTGGREWFRADGTHTASLVRRISREGFELSEWIAEREAALKADAPKRVTARARRRRAAKAAYELALDAGMVIRYKDEEV